MATYAVGDLQGCLDPLKQLLETVQFNSDRDQLWLVGDLINRGPQSLQTLEFLYPRRDNVIAVLGNHDLHLLACAFGHRLPSKSDTLDEILTDHNGHLYFQWLRQCPLMHHDAGLGYSMVHAGIPPQWGIDTALDRASEVQQVLQSPQIDHFFEHMYGNQPNLWDDNLEAPERWRMITNYFTRMRLCDGDGRLELKYKGDPHSNDDLPKGFKPWFAHPHRKAHQNKIIFGHWAALQGTTHTPNVYALDSGCVWGGPMTLFQLEDEHYFYSH